MVSLINCIPTAITPNGDGKNDFFILDILEICSEFYSDKELTIYNRWGGQVIHAKPYTNNWDGGDLPEGVYYYILEMYLLGGFIKTGNVTIIK